MGEFLPQLIGFGFVACLLGFVILFPRSPWTATLLERYGVRGGAEARDLTRADYLRGALAAGATAALLVAIAAALFMLAERMPNGTEGNLRVSAFAFIFTILGALAVAGGIIALWNGVRWRPRPAREGVDDQAI